MPQLSKAQVWALAQVAAKESGLDPKIHYGMFMQESSGNTEAVSRAGARGLAQFMPATAERFGLKDPFNPEASAVASGKYMKALSKMFKGDLNKAIMAYNAGEGNIQNGRVPGETRDYIKRVKAYSNQAPGDRMTKAEQHKLLAPLAEYSKLSSGYGKRNTGIKGASTFHEAVDIPAPTGTPVRATIGGTIKTAANKGKNGNYIVLEGDDGREHFFLHLNNFADGLKPGQRVEQGTEIGGVGNTSTLKIGSHLDYRIKENGKFIDPTPFLGGEALSALTKNSDGAPDLFGDSSATAATGFRDPSSTEARATGPFSVDDQLALLGITKFLDPETGLIQMAMPETTHDRALTERFDEYDEKTRGQLMALNSGLEQSEDGARQEPFGKYPTMFDDRLMKLIDRV